MSENQPAPETAKMRLDRVREYYNNGTLIKGEDYGVIPGTSKPTLLKPGAQKLLALFDLASEIKGDPARVFNDKMVAYEIIVTVRNKISGTAEGEGVGACNSQERKYKNKDKYEVANTLLKMAKKRALVDAALDALGCSSLFTQDIEDMDAGEPQERPRPSASHVNQPPTGTRPMPPQYLIDLWGEMKNAGLPYSRTSDTEWVLALNEYREETGAPPIGRLDDLDAEGARDAAEAIREGLVRVPLEAAA